MPDRLLWLYLTNAVLLINHEIDSAYWKEWELFRLPGGIAGFLLLHSPLLHFLVNKRWFLVVSDSRIQTGRKIIKDTKKIRDSSKMGYPLKKGERLLLMPLLNAIQISYIIIKVEDDRGIRCTRNKGSL